MAVFSMAGSNPALPTYPLQRSVRLRSSASAYFNRVLAASGTTSTFSAWVKRGALGSASTIFGTTDASTYDFQLTFTASNTLEFYSFRASAIQLDLITTQVFRDPSAWYHIVLVINTTNATAANRAQLFVNGVQVTAFSTATYPAQNAVTPLADSRTFGLGNRGNANNNYFDGYLTEVNFIDGQALTPSSFGAYNSYGVWSPAKYTGTYGTNGFYLNFQDNSALTTTANVGIGKDSSGNGNYWTSNNISLTAGATYDSMLDVPTNTSSTNANFCVLNPLSRLYNSNFAASDGNLKAYSSTSDAIAFTTMPFPKQAGKWYAECTIGALSGTGYVSIRDVITAGTDYSYASNGTIAGTASGATYTVNDVIGVAYDWSAQTIAWYKNNVLQGTTPSVAQTVDLSFANYIPNTSTNYIWNFGQRPFSYTPPTGYNRLCTYNLPDSIVPVGAQYFAATTYTGNGSTQSIVNTVNGFSLQPDLVWYKRRNSADNHRLFDAVRGATKSLFSDLTLAESTESGVTSFNTSGFTLGLAGNESSNTYVGWQWRASNASAVTNTSGSITSSVSASQTAGFSIVTYTGTGANATVGHGLGVAPRMMIIKRRNSTSNWPVYHASISGAPDNFLYLNSTSAVINAGVVFNGVTPNSTVFGVGTDAIVNASGGTYVAYCFAAVPGYSAFGSYTGNGSADGPFVYTGFRPRWILLKLTSSAGGGWYIYDTSRNTYNVMDLYLRPDASDAETTFTTLDSLSNGFKIRTSNTQFNGSGSTYIYAAFAENPFKNSLAR